jgi:hypothetical protein
LSAAVFALVSGLCALLGWVCCTLFCAHTEHGETMIQNTAAAGPCHPRAILCFVNVFNMKKPLLF